METPGLWIPTLAWNWNKGLYTEKTFFYVWPNSSPLPIKGIELHITLHNCYVRSFLTETANFSGYESCLRQCSDLSVNTCMQFHNRKACMCFIWSCLQDVNQRSAQVKTELLGSHPAWSHFIHWINLPFVLQLNHYSWVLYNRPLLHPLWIRMGLLHM